MRGMCPWTEPPVVSIIQLRHTRSDIAFCWVEHRWSQKCCIRTSTLLPLLHMQVLKVCFCIQSAEWKSNSPQLLFSANEEIRKSFFKTTGGECVPFEMSDFAIFQFPKQFHVLLQETERVVKLSGIVTQSRFSTFQFKMLRRESFSVPFGRRLHSTDVCLCPDLGSVCISYLAFVGNIHTLMLLECTRLADIKWLETQIVWFGSKMRCVVRSVKMVRVKVTSTNVCKETRKIITCEKLKSENLEKQIKTINVCSKYGA